MNRKNLPDEEYTLTEGAAWLMVKKFAIRVQKTDEGVVVDIYKDGEFTDVIATTYAFDHEVDEGETA